MCSNAVKIVKQAIGVLYKARIITIEKSGITLIAED
jgi:predicted RNA-binding protein (virulence factor B family)